MPARSIAADAGHGFKSEGIEETAEAGYDLAITGSTDLGSAATQAGGFGAVDALDRFATRRGGRFSTPTPQLAVSSPADLVVPSQKQVEAPVSHQPGFAGLIKEPNGTLTITHDPVRWKRAQERETRLSQKTIEPPAVATTPAPPGFRQPKTTRVPGRPGPPPREKEGAGREKQGGFREYPVPSYPCGRIYALPDHPSYPD